MIEGQWGKVARGAMALVPDYSFGVESIDDVIEKAKLAGLKYIYHEHPFQSWGHFTWIEDAFPGGDASMREIVELVRPARYTSRRAHPDELYEHARRVCNARTESASAQTGRADAHAGH